MIWLYFLTSQTKNHAIKKKKRVIINCVYLRIFVNTNTIGVHTRGAGWAEFFSK